MVERDSLSACDLLSGERDPVTRSGNAVEDRDDSGPVDLCLVDCS